MPIVGISTTLVIAGTSYANTQRPCARIHIDRLRRDLTTGYDELAFSLHGGTADAVWRHGTAVQAKVDYGDGAGPQLKFQGLITDIAWGPGPTGWVQAYTCSGLKWQCDRVPVTAPDASGFYTLNRTPDDPLYVQSQAGLTLGEMFTAVLTEAGTAAALAAVGIQYQTLSPPTLAAATVADFANLNVVPPQPVSFMGESLLSTLDQHVARWMPAYTIEVQPDGTVRALNTTDPTVFVPRTLTLPGPGSTGDPGVQWPKVRSSTARCASRVVIRGGPNTAAAWLSLVDGTLAQAWSAPDQAAWTISDFATPQNWKDAGTIVSISGNTATVQSSSATANWAANYWSATESYIYLLDSLATGISTFDFRAITANTALAAGGTATITWDASQPLDNPDYTNYRVVGTAGSVNNVGRLFTPRDPKSGAVGLDTWIGSHLVVRSPLPLTVANNGSSIQIYYTAAFVVGAQGGLSDLTVPLGVQVMPTTGQFMLIQPDVTVFGNAQTLASGYPTTTSAGLPADVQVLCLYSLGALEGIYPPDDGSGNPTYAGTFFTAMGQSVTKYIDVPAFVNQWDQSAMDQLAQQHLLAIQDVVYDGTGEFYGEPAWDTLTFNYSLNYAIAGTTSPFSAMNAPVRAVTVEWPQGAGYMHKVTFEFSNQRRPFSGDDMYLHPAFSGSSILSGLQGTATNMNVVAAAMAPEQRAAMQQGRQVQAMTSAGSSALNLANWQKPEGQRPWEQGLAEGQSSGMPHTAEQFFAGMGIGADPMQASQQVQAGLGAPQPQHMDPFGGISDWRGRNRFAPPAGTEERRAQHEQAREDRRGREQERQFAEEQEPFGGPAGSKPITRVALEGGTAAGPPAQAGE